jgi:exonuclease SbcC
MKLQSLRLSGIGCFRSEVSLPIDQLIGARIVAVCGANGAGKTTLLESIPGVLYGETPAHGPLARFANARNSFVEAIIETDKPYTVRRLINAVLKQPKSEAYLIGDDGAPLSNGKLNDFEAEVSKRFPSQRVFLSSAFASQKRKGQFLRIEKAERKALFAEMLGLGYLEAMSKAAGEHARHVETEVNELRARVDALSARACIVSELRSRLDHACTDYGETLAARMKAEEHAASVRAELDQWQERSRELDRALTEARSELREAKDRHDSAAKRVVDTQRRLASVGARRASLEERLGQRDELRACANEHDNTEAEIQRVEDEIKALHAKTERANQAIAEWRSKEMLLRTKLDAAERAAASEDERRRRAVESAEKDLKAAESTAERLRSVPCGGEGEYATCPLIANATAARDSMGELRSKAEAARRELQDARADDETRELRAEIEALGPCPTGIDISSPLVTHEDGLKLLKRSLQRSTEAAAQLVALSEVEAQATHADEEASELRAALGECQQSVVDADGASKQASGAVSEAETALNEHAKCKPAAVDERRLSELRSRETACATEKARVEAELKAAESAAHDAQTAKARASGLAADLDDWKHLQKSLGKDGIQALAVDAAGPEVSDIINELLHTCYGSRFTASLQTTTLKADGSGTKEIFDLNVIDTEMGTDGSADQLSGGEEVIVSEALSLAIAIYNCRRSSIPMLDLWRDECSGALDVDHAPLYVEMLRKAIDIGGFNRVYFIAHQPELWEMADARLRINNGVVSVG